MIKRISWIVAGLVLGLSIMVTYGVVAQPGLDSKEINITVTGLPENSEVVYWGIAEQAGNQEVPERVKLGVFSSQGSHRLTIPSTIVVIQVDNIHRAEGVRYAPEKSEYKLLSNESDLEIKFNRQYSLSLGSWARTRGKADFGKVRKIPIEVSPNLEGGWYNEGTTVSLEPRGDLQFAYWIIKDASGPMSTEVGDFSSAANPLQITMDQPKHVIASFVSEWMRMPKKANQEGIRVHNLVPGQRVRLVRVEDGTDMREAIVTEGLNFVQFEVPSGQTYKGYFQVTAPDGQTVIYESPVYNDLTAQDVFDY